MSSHVRHKAVVTGLGAVTRFGVGVGALLDGIDRKQQPPACVEHGALEAIDRRLRRRTARFSQFGILAAREAVAQAGLTSDHIASASCIVSTGIGGVEHLTDASKRSPSPFVVPGMMPNAAAAAISIDLGIHGESFSLGGACAGSTQAIGLALRAIRFGWASCVIVGGAEAPMVDAISDSFRASGALSPTGSCRPFDLSRDGFVMGEGSGILVLEEARFAASRGAKPLGTITGYGSSSDGYHITSSPEDAEPAAEAIHKALVDADRSTRELAVVSPHGTGTIHGDRQEARALWSALGDDLRHVPLLATKASTGHLFGAGGAVELIIALSALNNGYATGNVSLREADPELGPLLITDSTITLHNRPAALSTSFGFGGHNAALVCESIQGKQNADG